MIKNITEIKQNDYFIKKNKASYFYLKKNNNIKKMKTHQHFFPTASRTEYKIYYKNTHLSLTISERNNSQ